jgi:hypothetical protein
MTQNTRVDQFLYFRSDMARSSEGCFLVFTMLSKNKVDSVDSMERKLMGPLISQKAKKSNLIFDLMRWNPDQNDFV